jgi:hypothetical protein
LDDPLAPPGCGFSLPSLRLPELLQDKLHAFFPGQRSAGEQGQAAGGKGQGAGVFTGKIHGFAGQGRDTAGCPRRGRNLIGSGRTRHFLFRRLLDDYLFLLKLVVIGLH